MIIRRSINFVDFITAKNKICVYERILKNILMAKLTNENNFGQKEKIDSSLKICNKYILIR